MALPSTMKWNTVQSLSVMTKCSLTDTLSWLFLSLVNTPHTVRQGNGTVLPCGYPFLVFMSLLNTWPIFVHDPKKVLPCRYSEPSLSVSAKHTYANKTHAVCVQQWKKILWCVCLLWLCLDMYWGNGEIGRARGVCICVYRHEYAGVCTCNKTQTIKSL